MAFIVLLLFALFQGLVSAAKFDARQAQSLVPRDLSWSGQLTTDVQKLIVDQDEDFIVIFKPSTVLMQQDVILAKPEMELESNLFDEVKTQMALPGLGLVHRLDRPVSGLAVFSKNPKALRWLSESFRLRNASKYYVCVVNGKVHETAGTIDTCLVVKEGQKTLVLTNEKRAQVDEKSYVRQGKRILSAKLSYETLHVIERPESGQQQTLVKVKLETGRKHQIRAQMAHIGHPIVGDVKYGAPQRFQLKDIALHAFRLGFVHPTTKAPLTFSAGVPSSWASRFGQDVVDIVDRLCENKAK